MSQYKSKNDNNDSICPYCGDRHKVESEDYEEFDHEIVCDECGMKYWLSSEITVTHTTIPDCALNGKEHDFELVALPSGKKAYFCKVCDKCRLYEG